MLVHKVSSKGSLVNYLIEGRFAFLIVVGLATFFWWPSLWDGKILLHGDSAHLFLQLFSLQSRALDGNGSLLWVNEIYGGHPLFAEGQGGFANPLNIICAYIFEPTYGVGVLHWLCMVIGGGGIYRLCRFLDINRWPAVFSSVIVLFSTSWLNSYHNLAISVTLAWAPWFILAAERWLRNPGLVSACMLAVTVALLVTAGYPQISYAVMLYVLVSVIATLLYRPKRLFLLQNIKILVLSGTFAVFLAICLSAVQLFPLIELASLSHRNEGVGLLFPGVTSGFLYLKGVGLPNYWGMTASLGNLLAVFILLGIFFVRVNSSTAGYILATFILFNLGMEYASPIFVYVYENDLMPGLRSFRVTHLFFCVAVIGFGVISAYVLDRFVLKDFCGWGVSVNKLSKRVGARFFMVAVIVCLSIVAALSKIFLGSYSLTILVFLLSACVLYVHNKLYWLPLIAVGLSSIKAVVLYDDVFNFYPVEVLKAPRVIEEILNSEDVKLYRTHITGSGGVFVFIPPNSPDLEAGYQRYIKKLSPQAGMQWNISSIDGTLALPLSRWTYAYEQIVRDSAERFESISGERLLDILGVRFISFDSPRSIPGLMLFSKDEEQGLYVYENKNAKPRFQIYNSAVEVYSSAEVIAAINNSPTSCLFVESDGNAGVVDGRDFGQCSDKADFKSEIDLKFDSPVRYELDVNVSESAWLFIADSNYPGWVAKVNGKSTQVHSAQVLGKAVRLEAGLNKVEVEFSPRTFYIGLCLTVVGLGVVLLIFALHFRRLLKARRIRGEAGCIL